MKSQPIHILYCDYENEFPYSETLSRIGFLVDHVRADALRHVTVGDHRVYIFSFKTKPNMQEALATCERLKAAGLPTAIVLICLFQPGPEFLNHESSHYHADAYVANPSSVTPILDVLDSLVGCPIPSSMKGSLQLLQDEKQLRAHLEDYRRKVKELEERLEKAEGSKNSDLSLRPKLHALLKGQKLQFQSETERLKFQLSELEAQLLDREAKIKDLESVRNQEREKIEALVVNHEKAQKALREFYQAKIKSLSSSKA